MVIRPSESHPGHDVCLFAAAAVILTGERLGERTLQGLVVAAALSNRGTTASASRGAWPGCVGSRDWTQVLTDAVSPLGSRELRQDPNPQHPTYRLHQMSERLLFPVTDTSQAQSTHTEPVLCVPLPLACLNAGLASRASGCDSSMHCWEQAQLPCNSPYPTLQS